MLCIINYCVTYLCDNHVVAQALQSFLVGIFPLGFADFHQAGEKVVTLNLLHFPKMTRYLVLMMMTLA